jgi:hypothetical protein
MEGRDGNGIKEEKMVLSRKCRCIRRTCAIYTAVFLGNSDNIHEWGLHVEEWERASIRRLTEAQGDCTRGGHVLAGLHKLIIFQTFLSVKRW